MTKERDKSQKKHRRHVIHGITAAAAALRVTRQHLYYVLRGYRISPTLKRRYADLKRHQRLLTPTPKHQPH